jgi:spore cortex biosynthesis protein YabQ
MTTLSQQFFVFGLTIALGVLMGLLFDFYRVLNRLFRPSRLATQIGDLLFWLLLAGVVFFLLILGNWGEVRVYVVLGLILGLLGHLRWFSRTTIRIFNCWFCLMGKMYRSIIRIVSWPVRWLTRIVLVPVGWISIGFRRFLWPVFMVNNKIRNILKRWYQSYKNQLIGVFIQKK